MFKSAYITKKMFESSIEPPPKYYSIDKRKVTNTGTELGTKEETERIKIEAI